MGKLNHLEQEIIRRWGVTEEDLVCGGGDMAILIEDLARHDYHVFRYAFAVQALHRQLSMKLLLRETVALKIVLATVAWCDCDFYIGISTFVLAWERGVYYKDSFVKGDALGDLILNADPEGICEIVQACVGYLECWQRTQKQS